MQSVSLIEHYINDKQKKCNVITVTLHSAKISKRRVSSCSASLHLNYVCVLFANYIKVLHSGHVQTRITAV